MISPSERLASWRVSLEIYRHPRVLTLMALGFSSGLPLLLVFGTLSFWLREAGIDRATIGFISWVALAYGFKWTWAPLVDRLPIPLLTRHLGRRRAWLLLAQAVLCCAIAGMAVTDPALHLERLVWLALLVAFASATQDIAIDAFRIESGEPRLQAAMASTYMIGYRLAMIAASAGVLWISAWVEPDTDTYQHAPWLVGYGAMAVLMAVGITTTLLVSEPEVTLDREAVAREAQGVAWLHAHAWLPGRLEGLVAWVWRALISPFVDFISRYRWHAVLLLALIATYRISDIVLGVIANVFYVDLGFSKAEVANVTKVFGVLMTLLGALVGGLLVNRVGVMRILFAGAVLAAATNLLFAALAAVGNDIRMLILVIAMDNLSGGLASAVFIAYLSGLTNVSYSATQYALFSSVMLLFPKSLGGFSGVLVDRVGYPSFFLFTAVIGLPVLLLVGLAWRFVPVNGDRRDH
jgi:PAT family beta-lactamase induction signal transducer AmpG